jgi:hypothetical protein
MDIASRVHEGTRVTVRLPLDCERARPALKANIAHPKFERGVDVPLIPVKKSA